MSELKGNVIAVRLNKRIQVARFKSISKFRKSWLVEKKIDTLVLRKSLMRLLGSIMGVKGLSPRRGLC